MDPDQTSDAPALVRRHRALWSAIALVAALEVALVSLGGHRGAHAVRDVLLPGTGLVDERPLLGAGLIVVWLVAVVAWTRWGADWLVVLVTLLALSLTVTLTSPHDALVGALEPVSAAHEFPVVLLVVAALSRLRAVLIRIPGFDALVGRRGLTSRAAASLEELPPVDRARAVAITALAEPATARSLRPMLQRDDVTARARRVGAVARLRLGGDPLRRDHAHVRAALVLVGAGHATALATDASRSPVGLPCSEPTWIRPLDATLVALALQRAGHPETGIALSALLDGPWRLRSRSRPAWLWTPGVVAAGAALPWEHAASTAIARAAGWIAVDDDWHALRKRALGAAARHNRHRDDERLIAAARIWCELARDDQARTILARPSLTDPLARALDALAQRAGTDPSKQVSS